MAYLYMCVYIYKLALIRLIWLNWQIILDLIEIDKIFKLITDIRPD